MTEPRKPGRGYIALARGALNHPLTGAEKPYSRFEAWVWMLDRARYEPGRVRVSGGNVYQTIALERGQFSDSLRYLATAWGWQKTRVSTFLRHLENDAQIRTAIGTAQTVITICNYEQYQNAPKQNRTATDPATDPAIGQRQDKEKPRNQGTKKEIDISAPGSLISPEAFSLADEVLGLSKVDKNDTLWTGFPYVVQTLLSEGVTRETVLAACATSPVKNPRYFEKTIRSAWERRDAVQPANGQRQIMRQPSFSDIATDLRRQANEAAAN